MRAIGYPYDRLLREGYDFFTVEALCRYRGRAFFDEELYATVAVPKIGHSSFTFEVMLFRADEPIANGHIVNVMIDRDAKKPVRVPDSFREAIARAAQR